MPKPSKPSPTAKAAHRNAVTAAAKAGDLSAFNRLTRAASKAKPPGRKTWADLAGDRPTTFNAAGRPSAPDVDEPMLHLPGNPETAPDRPLTPEEEDERQGNQDARYVRAPRPPSGEFLPVTPSDVSTAINRLAVDIADLRTLLMHESGMSAVAHFPGPPDEFSGRLSVLSSQIDALTNFAHQVTGSASQLGKSGKPFAPADQITHGDNEPAF